MMIEMENRLNPQENSNNFLEAILLTEKVYNMIFARDVSPTEICNAFC